MDHGDRRPFVSRDLIEAGDHGVRVIVDQQTEALWNLNTIGNGAVLWIRNPKETEGRARLRAKVRLKRCELRRLILRRMFGDHVAA